MLQVPTVEWRWKRVVQYIAQTVCLTMKNDSVWFLSCNTVIKIVSKSKLSV